MATLGGLSERNRAVLTDLNQAFAGPFSVADAAGAAGMAHDRAARLLRHLASQGWLARVRRGLYTTVPLDADAPHEWRADPWVVAAVAVGGGYVGGWTALHHWDLTDQIFGTTVFLTTLAVPHRERSIGHARLELRHLPHEGVFGTRRVWREGTPVAVSDPERTLVDCLDDPSIGGGTRHLTEALVAYASSPTVRWGRVIEYGDRRGNRTVFKRLGLLAEAFELADAVLLDACRDRVSAGVGRLDPSRPATGPIVSRWGLRRNVGLES